MRVALTNSYVEFVIYSGVTERYPLWFQEEIYDRTFTDDSMYTFYVDVTERKPDYHEKQLVEDYSVAIRKHNGEITITDYDTFKWLYHTFVYDEFTHSGIAAFEEDCMDYIVCGPGALPAGYPDWFYEYFTEAVNLPTEYEGFLLFSENDEVYVDERIAILRNKNGEIRPMSYQSFLKYYDPDPTIGGR